ncbi:hypothetical protein S40288_02577 [Stachybotrys chartarum IBT 40288]|nr:hypothetical protein S40288_02577 [Stachybotrys chartarum IBT 40288]
MRDSSAGFTEAPSSWLASFSLCCAPLASIFAREPRRRKSPSATAISWPLGRFSDQDLLIDQDDEKHPYPVVCDPPASHPRPVAVAETMSQYNDNGKRHRRTKKSKGSNWTSFSMRSRLWSDASSRRPQISSPSDFRHVSSASFQYPGEGERRQADEARGIRPSSFRPLELSIHMLDHHASPMLPQFELPRAVATPPPAYHHVQSDEDQSDDDIRLVRQRSYASFLSFHVPRKPVVDSFPSPVSEAPPRIPPKSPGRARARTSPEMDRIRERVANAMNEMERLQKQIDDVIERQSLYSASRPSTSQSQARTVHDFQLEPMPSIPALPPAAPSFAERLNSDADRPATAPSRSSMPTQDGPEPPAVANRPPPGRREGRAPPPPLPLVLRPPLRKKKSFSRVSTWLFPSGEHSREISLESITNLPRPVKGGEGFYQCVAVGGQVARPSFESLNTVSTWESGDRNSPSVPTAWSPDSTPATKQDELQLERTGTFGSNVGRPAVGVAL